MSAIGPRTMASAHDVLFRKAPRATRASQSVFTLRQARLTMMSQCCANGSSTLANAHGPFEQREQRPLDAPRVGARKVDRGDERLRRLGQALVAGQSC